MYIKVWRGAPHVLKRRIFGDTYLDVCIGAAVCVCVAAWCSAVSGGAVWYSVLIDKNVDQNVGCV